LNVQGIKFDFKAVVLNLRRGGVSEEGSREGFMENSIIMKKIKIWIQIQTE
jgi:hypothetical protein